MNAADLTQSLRATNNGYLFAPTIPELECAKTHPELFKIQRGIISPVGFVVPQYQDPKPAPKVSHADFDYEGAIIARQYLGDI